MGNVAHWHPCLELEVWQGAAALSFSLPRKAAPADTWRWGLANGRTRPRFQQEVPTPSMRPWRDIHTETREPARVSKGVKVFKSSPAALCPWCICRSPCISHHSTRQKVLDTTRLARRWHYRRHCTPLESELYGAKNNSVCGVDAQVCMVTVLICYMQALLMRAVLST